MRLLSDLREHSPTTLVIVFGIAASIATYFAVREIKSGHANTAFNSMASTHANIIVEGFSQAFFAIQSVGALYKASDRVSVGQFADFTAPLLKRFPTITALGWAPNVNQDQREEFERAAQSVSPGFRITERSAQNVLTGAAERKTYFPVYLIHPYTGNEAAIGFDLYSEPVRRAAIDQARDTGRTVSTARIRLVQERGRQYSVLLIHPVYQVDDAAAGNRSLSGVASAVYRIGDGVERALSRAAPESLDIWLFDRSAEQDSQFLYHHSSKKQAKVQPGTVPLPPANAKQYVHGFDLGGREFELVLTPATGNFDVGGRSLAWLAVIVGLGFTGLLAAYLELVRHRARELREGQRALEDQINERKSAERQLREANRNLEILSREDPLTGIANRRHFDEYFQQEWKRAVRHGTSLSLLIGDVDNFKSYNDTYGHRAGDQCLREIARVVSDSTDRPGDLAARYGGEELALVLPYITESGAHAIAEKIRLAVAAIALPQAQTQPGKVVTISIGYGTVVPTRTSSMEEFVLAVDKALYRAKQQGRNRTVLIDAIG